MLQSHTTTFTEKKTTRIQICISSRVIQLHLQKRKLQEYRYVSPPESYNYIYRKENYKNTDMYLLQSHTTTFTEKKTTRIQICISSRVIQLHLQKRKLQEYRYVSPPEPPVVERAVRKSRYPK